MYAIRSYYGVYGPVRRGQTLWAVANAVRPAPSVTVPQTMLALYRKNPTAFAPGQLNNLYMGTRITSYNVCYTKLLRGSAAQTQEWHDPWR